MVVERRQGCRCVDKYKEEEKERDWMVVERRQGYECVDKSIEEEEERDGLWMCG